MGKGREGKGREGRRNINNMDWVPHRLWKSLNFCQMLTIEYLLRSDHKKNYCFKAFPAVHRHVTEKFIAIMEEPEKIPDCPATGITYLLTKSGNVKKVRNYQPIMCLKTMYTTITGITARRISTLLEEQDILPAEQRACHPGSKGWKDQLIISKAIYENCKRRNNNLSLACIDYQKAFDSIPQSWADKSIKLVAVNSKIVRFCKLSMKKWNTTQGFI